MTPRAHDHRPGPGRKGHDVPDEAAALAAFGYELGVLKRMRRAGWWHAGVRDPESVAEHTMRVAQLAAILAVEEGADPARAAFLALWHDTQETRTGDLPHTVSGYLEKPDPRQITADQTAQLPERSRDMIRGAVDEYEARQTPAALCAKDADKLEMLLQAVEYRDVGVRHVDGWIESARKGLTTRTGQRVAEAALTLSPLAWRTR
jgi:putative hydrolases of HD superfamily